MAMLRTLVQYKDVCLSINMRDHDLSYEEQAWDNLEGDFDDDILKVAEDISDLELWRVIFH